MKKNFPKKIKQNLALLLKNYEKGFKMFTLNSWENKATKIQLLITTLLAIGSITYTSYNLTTGFFMTRADADELIQKVSKKLEKASIERLLIKQMTLDTRIYQMEKDGDSLNDSAILKRIYKNALKQRELVDEQLRKKGIVF